MKLSKAFFLFVSGISTICAADKFLCINLDQCDKYSYGMFSVFNYVAGVLACYEHGSYAGMELDFKTYGLYFDPNHGPNWWEYYCDPIQVGSKNNAQMKYFNNLEYTKLAVFTEGKLSREEVYELIEKYIHPKQEIQKKIDQFVVDHFKESFVLGIHYRGTDKRLECERISYERVLESVSSYIQENNIHSFKIFVATDELEFLEFIESAYPGLIVTQSTIFSKDNKPVHVSNIDPYSHGEEAFIDCLLLSKVDVLFRTSSNLSLWSTYFNPNLPVIELTKRRESFKRFVEKYAPDIDSLFDNY